MSRTTLIVAAIAAPVLLAIGACTSPLAEAVMRHNIGDLEGAVQLVRAPAATEAMNGTGKDQLLELMEGGKILQDGGDGAGSIETMAHASRISERFATFDAKASFAELFGSAVINPSVRTYRGTYSERIRIDAYQTLNQLLRGDLRQAAVCGRRTAERQLDAKVEQAKQIDAVGDQIRSWNGGTAEQQVLAVLKDKHLTELDADPRYGAYLDPFASWISGIAWCSTGDAQEFRQGVSNIQEALQMMPENGVLRAQLAANPFELARQGQPQVLVLFENGVAPYYDQVTIPLFTPWTGVSTIPIQVPRPAQSPVSALRIEADGMQELQTELLADYNKIFGAQFKRMEPEIIFSTLVMIAVKEGATVGGYLATQHNGNAQAAVLIAASIYKALTNQCDLRTWRTPGMSMQIASFPRPASSAVTLSLVGGAVPQQRIALPPGLVTLVYVRSCVPAQVRFATVALWADPGAESSPKETTE